MPASPESNNDTAVAHNGIGGKDPDMTLTRWLLLFVLAMAVAVAFVRAIGCNGTLYKQRVTWHE